MRPSKDEYYLAIAKETAKRGTCLRREFGAVIVSNDQIISTGYCGAPRGVPNCSDLRKCYREERNIPAGEHYELCRSVHAEMNAIIHAARSDMINGTIYISGRDHTRPNDPTIFAMPCKLCKRMIINAGIKRVVTTDINAKGFSEHNVDDWIKQASIDPFAELDQEGYGFIKKADFVKSN